jgi:hypothetical protein
MGAASIPIVGPHGHFRRNPAEGGAFVVRLPNGSEGTRMDNSDNPNNGYGPETPFSVSTTNAISSNDAAADARVELA